MCAIDEIERDLKTASEKIPGMFSGYMRPALKTIKDLLEVLRDQQAQIDELKRGQNGADT